MLLVKTYLAYSPIHGIGVFTEEHVPKGTAVWRFDDLVDRRIAPAETALFPPLYQTYVKHYGYLCPQELLNPDQPPTRDNMVIILCGDDARFFNHSDDPNVVESPLPGGVTGEDVAARDIVPGEELTCDYFSFDAEAAEKLGRSAYETDPEIETVIESLDPPR